MAEITWLLMIISAAILAAYYVYPKNTIAAIFVFFIIFFIGVFGGYRIFEYRKRESPYLERKE